MVVFKKSKKTTIFKRRSLNKKLIFFENYNNESKCTFAVAKNNGFIEPKIYIKLKRIIRKNSKKGRKASYAKVQKSKFYNLKRKFKKWFFLRPNYIVTKKSKNSRMGKGKGSFKRWIIRVNRGDTLFKIFGTSPYRLSKIINKNFNKKLRVKFKIFVYNNIFFSYSASKIGANLIFKKYRYS